MSTTQQEEAEEKAFYELQEYIRNNQLLEASQLLEQHDSPEEIIEWAPPLEEEDGDRGEGDGSPHQRRHRTYVHPLYLAAKLGRVVFIRLLLTCGGDPFVRHCKKGFAPIHVAVVKNQFEAVQELIQQHDKDDERTFEMVELETDTSGKDPLCTPLHFAVEIDDPQQRILKLLLSHGADYNRVDTHNKTSLWRATQRGLLPNVLTLLQARADTNIPDDRGITPLAFAASQSHLALCEALLRNGADPNRQDNMGDTVLHHAAQIQIQRVIFNYNLDMMETCQELFCMLLLNSHANENLRNKEGDLPLDVIEIPLANLFDFVIKHRNNLAKQKASFNSIMQSTQEEFQTKYHLTQEEATAFVEAIRTYKAYQQKKNESRGGGPCTLVNTQVTPYKRKFADLFASGRAITESDLPNNKKSGDEQHHQGGKSKCPFGFGGQGKVEGTCPVTGLKYPSSSQQTTSLSPASPPTPPASASSPSPVVARCPVTGLSGVLPPGHADYVEALKNGKPKEALKIPSQCPFSPDYKPPNNNDDGCAQQ